MSDAIKPQRALLSVSDKTGLIDFAKALSHAGIELISTGGTARALQEAGLSVRDVADVTGFPEIMDGRVKTLQPAIHGGILARRDVAAHQQAMQEHDIAPIDLVVVNLYPFAEAIHQRDDYDHAVENIDIGGPAMLRAAAKNHAHVAVVVDPQDYPAITEALQSQEGGINYRQRQQLAAKAFAYTASYDTLITQWFSRQDGMDALPHALLGATRGEILRYGENPHQQAAVYPLAYQSGSVLGATQHQGKALSYNNINDTDAAWRLVHEFDAPAVAIIKHANPCGVAIGESLPEAYHKALACDPVSAFGGIIAVNGLLDESLVEAIGTLFCEVIIAPNITEGARVALAKKKNLRLLEAGQGKAGQPLLVKSVSGGYLVQTPDEDLLQTNELNTVSRRQPGVAEERDLHFAFAVCKHVKSNAIVLAKDGATIGIGAGQMSRVDSVRLACQKAQAAGLNTEGSVLASDAFFPFDDNVHHAAQAGVIAVIQPGGSVRDAEVIAAADQYDMAMVTTGIRHFNH